MRYLLALVCLILAGCGTARQNEPTVHPNGHRPLIALNSTPYVEVMGDDQSMELVNFAQFHEQNPMWRCSTCAPGQPSAQLLADAPDGSEVSRVIALKPDVVVILTGASDLIDFPMNNHLEPTAQNIVAVVAQLTKAGISSLVLYPPESTAYDPYYTNYAIFNANQSGDIPNLLPYPVTDDPLSYTDGADFSQAGLELLYPAVYDRIQQFHKGGQK